MIFDVSFSPSNHHPKAPRGAAVAWTTNAWSVVSFHGATMIRAIQGAVEHFAGQRSASRVLSRCRGAKVGFENHCRGLETPIEPSSSVWNIQSGCVLPAGADRNHSLVEAC